LPGVGPKPSAPAGDNDPTFEISRARQWYLIGNNLTTGHDAFDIQVVAPDGVGFVDMWMDDQPGVRLVDAGTDFRQSIDVAALEPGEHEVLLAADGADTAFARVTFTRTHPLYVLVSTDWDDADNTDDQLGRQQLLHDEHPELRLTHFVGPYTFTDTTVTTERVGQLVDWLLDMRDAYDDEIGLHIHPYCNFVDTTSVPCRTEPSTVYPAGDDTGYTVIVGSYTEEEFTTLLNAAGDLFEQHGLGRPTSFRAGGWTAEINTMHSLAAAGYVVDSSANNWARMEEWDGSPPDAILYDWNMEAWGPIGDTSQPYYPNVDDILSDAAPTVPVLEVPDNGILVDYVEYLEMVEIFEANWPGGALTQPTVFQIGFHPPNFSDFFRQKIDATLDETDLYRYSRDEGPVVYATLSEMVQVWPAN
jgi:hypothetical protein